MSKYKVGDIVWAVTFHGPCKAIVCKVRENGYDVKPYYLEDKDKWRILCNTERLYKTKKEAQEEIKRGGIIG